MKDSCVRCVPSPRLGEISLEADFCARPGCVLMFASIFAQSTTTYVAARDSVISHQYQIVNSPSFDGGIGELYPTQMFDCFIHVT